MGRKVKIEFAAVGECPVCGDKKAELIERAASYGNIFTYACCLSCGLVRMDPRPTKAGLDHFYSHFYMSSGSRDAVVHQEKQITFGRFLVFALSSNVRLDRIASILDVGCGYGGTLAVIKNAVCQQGKAPMLYGLEPSKDAAETAKQTVHMELIGRYADELAAHAGNFDLIVLSHVLEHTTHPIETLRLLRSKLAPGGHILMEVPNYYGHPSVDLGHNFLFTKESLSNVIACAGLSPNAMYVTDHISDARPQYITAVLEPTSDFAKAPLAVSTPAQVSKRRHDAWAKSDFARPRSGRGDAIRLAAANILSPV